MVAYYLLFHALQSMVTLPPPDHAPSSPSAQHGKTVTAPVDNFADASRLILKCYHPTATYRSSDIVQVPWDHQSQFGATKSALVKLNYVGKFSQKHVMTVAVMARASEIRAQVVDDVNRIQADPKCELVNWVKVEPPKPKTSNPS